MPKPGYYYYQNRRALIGIGLLTPFVVGAFLSKFGSPSDLTAAVLFAKYQVPIALGIVGLIIFLFVLRRVQMFINEPRPANYSSRAEFLVALEKYCARRRYRHGWVYYRSQELWPE